MGVEVDVDIFVLCCCGEGEEDHNTKKSWLELNTNHANRGTMSDYHDPFFMQINKGSPLFSKMEESQKWRRLQEEEWSFLST